ncbi:MAG: hypothetical protein KGN16_00125 [Burkholderiales bacterium]|nr:hypothetical protein [Burkholderiales bacterium]
MKFALSTRRQWLLSAAALSLSAHAAPAMPPVVEIIAFSHPPVHAALVPLREWLGKQGGKVKVVEIDMETPAAEKRLQALGLKGHLPIVVLVDGQYRYKRADGSAVEFVNFPAGPGTMPGIKGAWSDADVQAVLKPRLQ